MLRAELGSGDKETGPTEAGEPRGGAPFAVETRDLDKTMRKQAKLGTSLVVQWLRIHHPMQGDKGPWPGN